MELDALITAARELDAGCASGVLDGRSDDVQAEARELLEAFDAYLDGVPIVERWEVSRSIVRRLGGTEAPF